MKTTASDSFELGRSFLKIHRSLILQALAFPPDSQNPASVVFDDQLGWHFVFLFVVDIQ